MSPTMDMSEEVGSGVISTSSWFSGAWVLFALGRLVGETDLLGRRLGIGCGVVLFPSKACAFGCQKYKLAEIRDSMCDITIRRVGLARQGTGGGNI